MHKHAVARRQYIEIFLIIALALAASGRSFPEASTPSLILLASTPDGTGTGFSTSWIQVYFADPTAVHAKDYEGGPDEVLAAALDKARLSIDVAAYRLNLWSIRDAVIKAHEHGVVVRMVMESDDMDNQEVQ